MNDQDRLTIEAMLTFGGSFVHALGSAAMRADSINLSRIKAAFPEYWEEYTEMAKRQAKIDEGENR